MKTPDEYRAWQAELDAKRGQRRTQDGVVWPTPDNTGMGTIPIQVAPGRGDLNYSSSYYPVVPTSLRLLGGRAVSFTRLFQSQPWIAAAVMRLLTWAIRVPLRAYRTADDPNDRDPLAPGEHPIAGMIARPWDRGGPADLTQALLGPMLVHGNSTTTADDTANSDVIELDSKDWRYCQPIMPWRDSLEGFRFDTDSPEFMDEVSIDKVLHCHYWSPDGPLGTSPLQQLGVSLQIEDAAQRYQRSVFQQGGRPPSAVTASDAFLGIEPEERREIMAQLRRDITELYGGPENMSKPALLPPGLDWKPLGGTVVEAALIEQRKITRDEVCAVYLIPPPMLGILDRATYSNISVQRDMIYTHSLGPPLVIIEQAINCQLIRDLLQEEDVFVEFDFSKVLRGDRIAEINALRSAISTALMSPNEGRVVLGMPHVDEPLMDDYFIPANNLKPISGLGPQDFTPKAAPPRQPPRRPPPPAPVPPPPGAMYVVRDGRQELVEPSLNGHG